MSELFNQCRDQPVWAAVEIERLTTESRERLISLTKAIEENTILSAEGALKDAVIESADAFISIGDDETTEWDAYVLATRVLKAAVSGSQKS